MSKISLPLAILAILIAIVSFFFSNSSSQQVYVDVNKLLDGYKRTAIVRADFEKKSVAMNANVDSLIGDWQSDLKNYEKERSSMSKKEIELKQELLANKQNQIGAYRQAIQQQLQEEDQKVTQTVINDINDFVKEYGKQKGYRIIFGATGGGTIMYAEDDADLTQEVLDKLNASFDAE